MSVEQRILMCRIIDKIEAQKEYSKRLGLENFSKFHGRRLATEEAKR